jgi:hypothetical protein
MLGDRALLLAWSDRSNLPTGKNKTSYKTAKNMIGKDKLPH